MKPTDSYFESLARWACGTRWLWQYEVRWFSRDVGSPPAHRGGPQVTARALDIHCARVYLAEPVQRGMFG